MLRQAVAILTQDMTLAPEPPAKFEVNFVIAMIIANRDIHPWPDEGKALTFYQNNYGRFKENLKAWHYSRWLRADQQRWKDEQRGETQNMKYSQDYQRYRRRQLQDHEGEP